MGCPCRRGEKVDQRVLAVAVNTWQGKYSIRKRLARAGVAFGTIAVVAALCSTGIGCVASGVVAGSGTHYAAGRVGRRWLGDDFQ